MSYPRFQRARDFKRFARTAGDLTLNSTSWADLPTIGTTWDAVLSAQVGDVIEAGVSALCSNATPTAYLDVVSIVASAAVTSFAAGVAPNNSYTGVMGWRMAGSAPDKAAGSVLYPVAAGDLSAGTVTVRLRYRTSTATNRTLNATPDVPLHFWAKNLGPADPN